MILVTLHAHTPHVAYIQRRLQEGKTRRQANRCRKRYLAPNLYRLLEHEPLTDIQATLAQASGMLLAPVFE